MLLESVGKSPKSKLSRTRDRDIEECRFDKNPMHDVRRVLCVADAVVRAFTRKRFDDIAKNLAMLLKTFVSALRRFACRQLLPPNQFCVADDGTVGAVVIDFFILVDRRMILGARCMDQNPVRLTGRERRFPGTILNPLLRDKRV